MSVNGQTSKQAGGLLFALIFVACSIFLLSQLGAETRYSAKGKLFAQPAFWPAVGVIGMTVFGLLHLFVSWTRRCSGGWREGLVWLRALEYLAWFMIYVYVTPFIGYLPATLLFTALLTFRAGYRKPQMLLIGLATGFCIVFIFKTLLAVRIPGAVLYEYLPDAARNFMIINF